MDSMAAPTRLGIFGGTFDPPHVGHLILAEIALAALELDRLLWVLTPDPPHKQGRLISPLVQRLELLHAALAGDDRFELSRIDIDRPPPHYALDTVRLLRENYPDAQLIYLMGGDSLRDLPTWHQPQKFVLACDEIGVMRRPGAVFDLTSLAKQLPGLSQRVRFVEAPLIEIAASDIRRRVAAGLPYRYFLPEKVYQLIKSNGLYAAYTSELH
jgi:nicotinate-nucleotide adenylyltransferase